ncbi:MAG: cyclic nucleotide-binding domain-containing protein [Proteobacteria bacterium]|nr:cyclic nucleotide-binding domain-containing protein [Pseudomonadota bacterium]MBU1717397.1 cyclic nucleotide-binding domain-containing protein [Pseudomonadota bacterium]
MEKRIKEIIESQGSEISIIHLLEPEEREKIASCFELVYHPAKTVIIKEGEKINYIGIVASGELKFERQGKFAKPITLALITKGAHIGDFSMQPEREVLGQLRTLTDTELLVITHAKLEAFIQENPYTGIKILKGISTVLSIRLKNAIDKIVFMS